jgi:hypothetical protein
MAAALLFPPRLLAEGCDPVYKVTVKTLGALMRAEGYDIDRLPGLARNYGYIWTHTGGASSVRISSNGTRLHYYGAYAEGEASFEQLNAWNRDHYFSRAFTDSEGDPGLYMDLSLEGGVCRERLKNFLETCLASNGIWKDALERTP